MKKHLIIATIISLLSPLDTDAKTVWCSAMTCGDWDEDYSADFCGSSHKWCLTEFGAQLGYGDYQYCVPFGGYYLQSSETYSASLKIVCFSDLATCNAIKQQAVPWNTYSDYMQPKSGYFIGCSSTGTTSTSDWADSIYACPPGQYSRRGFKARNADGVSSLGCESCTKGYYSAGVASECSQCPSSGGITGTTAQSRSTSITDCYIPAGQLSWTDDSGTYVCGENSYYTE